MNILLLFICPIPLVILLQAIFLRLLPNKSAQLVTISCMVLGIPVYGFLYFSITFFEYGIYHALYYFFIYCFSTYTYFHFFNMSETSRRVRLVYVVGNGVQADSISHLYSAKQMIEVRLNRLIALGQITKNGDRYYLCGNLFYFVAVILAGIARLLRRPW